MEHSTQAYRDRFLFDIKTYYDKYEQFEKWKTFLDVLEVLCQQYHILSENASIFDVLREHTEQEVCELFKDYKSINSDYPTLNKAVVAFCSCYKHISQGLSQIQTEVAYSSLISFLAEYQSKSVQLANDASTTTVTTALEQDVASKPHFQQESTPVQPLQHVRTVEEQKSAPSHRYERALTLDHSIRRGGGSPSSTLERLNDVSCTPYRFEESQQRLIQRVERRYNLQEPEQEPVKKPKVFTARKEIEPAVTFRRRTPAAGAEHVVFSTASIEKVQTKHKAEQDHKKQSSEVKKRVKRQTSSRSKNPKFMDEEEKRKYVANLFWGNYHPQEPEEEELQEEQPSLSSTECSLARMQEKEKEINKFFDEDDSFFDDDKAYRAPVLPEPVAPVAMVENNDAPKLETEPEIKAEPEFDQESEVQQKVDHAFEKKGEPVIESAVEGAMESMSEYTQDQTLVSREELLDEEHFREVFTALDGRLGKKPKDRNKVKSKYKELFSYEPSDQEIKYLLQRDCFLYAEKFFYPKKGLFNEELRQAFMGFLKKQGKSSFHSSYKEIFQELSEQLRQNTPYINEELLPTALKWVASEGCCGDFCCTEDGISTEQQQNNAENLTKQLDSFLEENDFEVDLTMFMADPKKVTLFEDFLKERSYVILKDENIYLNMKRVGNTQKSQLKKCIEKSLKSQPAFDVQKIQDECQDILQISGCQKTCVRRILRYFFANDYDFYNSLIRRKGSHKTQFDSIEDQFAELLGERDYCNEADLLSLDIGLSSVLQVVLRVDDDKYTLPEKLVLENKQGFINAVQESAKAHGGCESLAELLRESATFGRVHYQSHLEQPWNVYLLAQMIELYCQGIVTLRKSALYFGYLYLNDSIASDNDALVACLINAHNKGLIDLSESSTNIEDARAFLTDFIGERNVKKNEFYVPARATKLFLDKLVSEAWEKVRSKGKEL